MEERMASTFKRGDVWYVRYIGVDGKWTQESCGRGVTKAQAEIIRNNKEQIGINMRHKAPIRLIETDLISQLVFYRDKEIFRSNEGRKKARATVIRYQQIIDNFIEYVSAHGWKLFKEITPMRIKDFIEYLTDLQSPASIIMHRLELIKFFKWAISQNFLIESPMGEIKNPRVPKNEKTKTIFFFSEAQLNDIFENATGVYKDIFKFLYFTGLRIGELENAEFSHIIEIQNIETNKLMSRLIVPVMEGNKTKRETSIPLSDEALAIIAERKKASYKTETADAKKYIFVNMEGLKLDNANIYRNLKVVLRNCNITGGHPHTFRHTFASHLVMKGVPLYIVKELLRHASIEETMIYSHLSEDVVREASNKLSSPKPRLHFRQLKFKPSSAANAG
jgi:site-specific recombinase XerD